MIQSKGDYNRVNEIELKTILKQKGIEIRQIVRKHKNRDIIYITTKDGELIKLITDRPLAQIPPSIAENWVFVSDMSNVKQIHWQNR